MHRRLLAPLAALCLLCVSLAGAAAAADGLFRKDPYLGVPADGTRMPVQWQLRVSAPCTLTWGRGPLCCDAMAVTEESGPDHLHRHTMEGLVPATRYFYRVRCGGETRGGEFRTWPAADETTLAFIVYGDTRSQPDVHDAVAGAILDLLAEADDHRTLLISTGDLVSNGDRESAWDEQFFSPHLPRLRRLLAGAPLVASRGNHEKSGLLFQRYFPYPDGGRGWWSFDVGPAHFVVLDQYRDYSPGSPQYAWLERDLAATDRRWRILVLHQPGWSAGAHRNTEKVQRFLQPLCVRYGVSLVLAGHNHYYARCDVDGVQHITTGGGGAPLYTPRPDHPHVVAAAKAYHFCRVEIRGGELRFVAQDLDGRVLDAFTLHR